MAPPQVDVTKKQPLEDVQGWAAQVGENKLPPMDHKLPPPMEAEKLPPPMYCKLPPLNPSAPAKTPVPVETSITIAGKRTVLAKRRCKKLVIGMVIGAVVATLIVVGAFMAHRHHKRDHDRWHHEAEDGRGHHAEEHVRTEGSRSLIHIARNATNHFFALRAVLDYETRLAGFKDCSRQRCYIDRLRESYEEGCERWRHYQKHGRLLTERPLRVGPQVEEDVLEYFGGEEIFELCHQLPTYWVIEIEREGDSGSSSGSRGRDSSSSSQGSDSDSESGSDSESESESEDESASESRSDDEEMWHALSEEEASQEASAWEADNSTEIIFL